MAPHINHSEVIAQGRFLSFCKVTFTDARGCQRSWEAVNRRNGSDSGSNAVFIVAKIVPENEIVLVRQFRPPAGRMMLEFPAGLIDPGETAETTAVRELYEETGFTGEVKFCTAGSFSSPGMTGESIVLAAMEIDGSKYPDRLIPPNHQEECENIEVFRVKSDQLKNFVAEQEAAGCGIDSKIHTVLAFREMGL